MFHSAKDFLRLFFPDSVKSDADISNLSRTEFDAAEAPQYRYLSIKAE